MNERNDEQEYFEYVTLFGILALLSEGRVARRNIPQGLFAYDLRGADDDFGRPATLETHVGVNHAGTLITAKPILIPETDYVDIRDQIHYMGDEYTLREFELAMFPERANSAERQTRADGSASEPERETAFLSDTGNAFAIYQLKVTSENRDRRFESFDRLISRGFHVQKQNYEFQYAAPLPPGEKDAQCILEEVFVRFNLDRPSDFTGHSVSTSDVIALKLDNQVTAYYVDVFGFQDLPDFLEKENLPKRVKRPIKGVSGMIEKIDDGKSPSIKERLRQPVKQAIRLAKPGKPERER